MSGQLVPSRQQQINQLNTRQTNTRLDTTQGVIGLAGVGGLAAKHIPGVPEKAKNIIGHGLLGSAVVGAGVGGALSLRRAAVDRANIAEQRKKLGVSKAMGQRKRFLAEQAYLMDKINKIDTTMSAADAHKHVQRYGASGPLPANLDRATKMKVHEARYIHHGGPAGEKYHARAKISQKAQNVGLAVGTGAGVAYLGAKSNTTRRLGRLIARKVPRLAMDKNTVAHNAEMAGVSAATASGAAELYGNHLKHKRASHANAPAGVSASALNRMRQMDGAKK